MLVHIAYYFFTHICHRLALGEIRNVGGWIAQHAKLRAVNGQLEGHHVAHLVVFKNKTVVLSYNASLRGVQNVTQFLQSRLEQLYQGAYLLVCHCHKLVTTSLSWLAHKLFNAEPARRPFFGGGFPPFSLRRSTVPREMGEARVQPSSTWQKQTGLLRLARCLRRVQAQMC